MANVVFAEYDVEVDVNELAVPLIADNEIRNTIIDRLDALQGHMNNTMNDMRNISEEVIVLTRALGNDPNAADLNVYRRLFVNIGDGAGTNNPQAYHPTGNGIPNERIAFVQGISTMDRVGTTNRTNIIINNLRTEYNAVLLNELRGKAMELNPIVDNLPPDNTVAAPTIEEQENAIDVLRRAVKRRRLNASDIAEQIFSP